MFRTTDFSASLLLALGLFVLSAQGKHFFFDLFNYPSASPMLLRLSDSQKIFQEEQANGLCPLLACSTEPGSYCTYCEGTNNWYEAKKI